MNCTQCPVSCGADRTLSKGYCGVSGVKLAKYYLHPFEEPPISFKNGSGCVFFCGCSLKCVFCQNYEVSRAVRGKDFTVKQLAEVFKRLEDMGADNINLVNPTHYVAHIAEAMSIYKPSVPVVYNTHGYEKVPTLEIADTFTDIYLPDLKFIDKTLSKRYTGREDYAEYALPAIKFMAKKPLDMRGDGKMLSGCIVRHLILPLAAYDSVEIVKFVSTLPEGVYFSLMSQYTPFGDIKDFKELQRPITRREYNKVLAAVEEYGLKNVFLQDESSSGKDYIPNWDF
ncbi:MAG TPA: radical SAM protein [Candidatus Coproplasma avicola]|uniref:Radical SAM protein n=1 Tax=Candidatus Coproplasma avicola TaxID=2840744 RepID=A0A9D1E791_9FIRM|nr:radical SAM protein [Candidatus Coproplasma avicola]